MSPELESFFAPPPEFAGDFGHYKSPLIFDDGRRVERAEQWPARRKEILDYWHGMMDPWPKLLDRPQVQYLQEAPRENFTQHKVRVEVDSGERYLDGYILAPEMPGPLPAMIVVFYKPDQSIGLDPDGVRNFGLQLTRRGFVTLSVGSPSWSMPFAQETEAPIQPLSYLAYLAANLHTALSQMEQVDPNRIGILGHSYGGKWAMFASCLYEKFACSAWSDPGIVFDESRPNVNYWEPWYLGKQPGNQRERGIVTAANPRTGVYKALYEGVHDLHELHALMAPRPFLVSGGAEDPRVRWKALNHSIAVNNLLGYSNRVAMTNRPTHSPDAESNEAMYRCTEMFLKAR